MEKTNDGDLLRLRQLHWAASVPGNATMNGRRLILSPKRAAKSYRLKLLSGRTNDVRASRAAAELRGKGKQTGATKRPSRAGEEGRQGGEPRPVPLRVTSVGRRRAVVVALCDRWLPLDCRYAPFATDVMRRRKMTRRAKSRHSCARKQVVHAADLGRWSTQNGSVKLIAC